MKFLADANIGRLIVNFLEARGHDVLRASSFPPRTPDDEILRTAVDEGRVVVTADKDFGELVFRQQQAAAAGVILLRIDVKTERQRLDVIEHFWPSIEPAIDGHFVVVTRLSVRRTPLPSP